MCFQAYLSLIAQVSTTIIRHLTQVPISTSISNWSFLIGRALGPDAVSSLPGRIANHGKVLSELMENGGYLSRGGDSVEAEGFRGHMTKLMWAIVRFHQVHG